MISDPHMPAGVGAGRDMPPVPLPLAPADAARQRLTIGARPPRKVVFIGGLHRSGTTHLARLLGQHPESCVMAKTGVVMDEGQYLQDIYPSDRVFGGPGRFAFSPAAGTQPVATPDEAAAIRRHLIRQWGPYWNLSKSVLVEKSPGNCLNARFLQSVFGNAYFVFISRHPIAVSLATRKWSRTSMFSLVDHWMAAHQAMRRDLPHLRNVCWISYEQLVADPAGTVAAIWDFIGLPAPAAALAPTEDCNAGYFETWQNYYVGPAADPSTSLGAGHTVQPSFASRLLHQARARARRHVLLRGGIDVLSTANEGKAIVSRFEGDVRAFGYSLTDLSLFPTTDQLQRQHPAAPPWADTANGSTAPQQCPFPGHPPSLHAPF
jgi:hypothetical protein